MAGCVCGDYAMTKQRPPAYHRMVRVQEGARGDIESWLQLAAQVQPLFWPMPDFESLLERNIDRGTALVVRGEDGAVSGGMLFGRSSQSVLINWLAVASDVRRRGVGESLVHAVIARADDLSEVRVTTFGHDVTGGRPGRALYVNCGFTAGTRLPDGPDGRSRQLFTLSLPASAGI